VRKIRPKLVLVVEKTECDDVEFSSEVVVVGATQRSVKDVSENQTECSVLSGS